MTVLEIIAMSTSVAATAFGGVAGLWKIGRWFSKAEASNDVLGGKLDTLTREISASEERTNVRIDAIAATLRPLSESIASLRGKLEDLRVEAAQNAARFDAHLAREETMRLRIDMLAEDVKHLGSRIDRLAGEEGE